MSDAEPKSNNDLACIETSNRGLVLTNLDDMQMTAQLILQSGLCPDGYKTKAQVFVGLQSGAEIGLKPMQALNSIAIIKGKPSLWGDAALGLVKRSGLLSEFSEKVSGEGDKMCAFVKSIRKFDRGETGSTVETTFSVADAKTARLWGKAGPWTTHPKRMLKYKARAFNLRDNFPDVLMGMHLTEEMEGEEPLPAPACDVPPRGERRKKVDAITMASEDGLSKIEGVHSETGVRGDRHLEGKIDDTEIPEPLAEPVTEEVKDDKSSASITYEEVKKLYDSFGYEDFTAWAAEELCRGEEEVEKPEQFTAVMLEELKRKLEPKGE